MLIFSLTFVNTVVDYWRRCILRKIASLHNAAVKQMTKTVLIVDDEPVDRFIAEQIIARTGQDWKIVSFPGAIKALNFLSFQVAHGGRLPELILLDLLMPDINGTAFLKTLNQLYPKHKETSRIIMLTISENRDRWRDALAQGAAKVIVKPLTADKWLAACEATGLT